MSTEIIDFEQAVKLVNDQVVALGSDYVYQRPADRACMYTHGESKNDATPGCIIGHVLVTGLDVPIAELWHDEHTRSHGGTVSGLSEHWEQQWGVKFTNKARIFLGRVQAAQDDGLAWGESIVTALEKLNTYRFDGDNFAASVGSGSGSCHCKSCTTNV